MREHELAVMAAAFSDHAYALPSASSLTDSAASPRKSARIKQRADDGKSSYDSDFEYYTTSTRRGRKKEDQSDGERMQVSGSQSPAPSSPASRSSQPKRCVQFHFMHKRLQ